MDGMKEMSGNLNEACRCGRNLYIPDIAVIRKIVDETEDVETFHLSFKDEVFQREFTFKPGQFAEYSVFGAGEAPFCISSSPTETDHFECTVRRVGKVTNSLHRLGVGAEIGVRGPYGNGFPTPSLAGKNLVFVAGGIGLAPLRSLIRYALDNRSEYGKIDIIYGARRPSDLCFKNELSDWGKNPSLNLTITVDKGEAGWGGREGFVPQVLKEAAPSAEKAYAIVCGPPVMNRATFPVLEQLRFAPERILTTLEKKMKCGIGKCGHCNVGNLYVCRDGPVFSLAQIQNFISSEY